MTKKNIKKLYRTRNDKIIAGVCGGIAKYLEIDSTLIRVLWAIVTIFTGGLPGIVAYIVAIIIMPEK